MSSGKAFRMFMKLFPQYPHYPQTPAKVVFTRAAGCSGLAFFGGYVKIHLPCAGEQGILFRLGKML